MALDTHHNDIIFYGSVIFGGAVTFPALAITDAQVAALANIDASKLERRVNRTYFQVGTDDVTPDRRVVHVVYGSTGQIVAFRAGVATAFGAASSCVVDLLKNGVSILTATITLSNAQIAYQLVSPAGYTSVSLAANDVLEVQVKTITGTNLAKGLFADLVLDELPQ